MRAAVFDGRKLVVSDEVEVEPPMAGQVQVRVLASGICHSDLNVMDGAGGSTEPIILGHEAAGVVVAHGPGVSVPAVGTPVVVGAATPCGICRYCRGGHPTQCPDAFGQPRQPFRWRGAPVRSYANVSSFAEQITVRADQLVVTDGLPASSAALIGCAVSTGYGAVANVAAIAAGDTVVVLGVGGIGVNAIQTARLRGAATIVAVDVNPAKEGAARRFGATDFLPASKDTGPAELVELVRQRAGGPIDAVIECCGVPAAVEAAMALPGPGGIAAMVGITPPGYRATLDVNALLRGGHRVVGSLNGEVDPARDLPEIVALAQAGRLELDAQVSRIWPLEEIDAAIAAVRAGEVVRAVLDLDQQ